MLGSRCSLFGCLPSLEDNTFLSFRLQRPGSCSVCRSDIKAPGQTGRRAYLDSTTRRQPPKSEFRGPKPERRPNTEGRSHARAFRISGFGLLSALGFRASGLGLCAHGLVVLSSTPTRTYASCCFLRRDSYPHGIRD